VFPNAGGQQHQVRDTQGQLGSQGKDCYRAASEKESCVK